MLLPTTLLVLEDAHPVDGQPTVCVATRYDGRKFGAWVPATGDLDADVATARDLLLDHLAHAA